MEDIAATQQYYRYLLPNSPIPGYIQYFVQDPFIVYLYGHIKDRRIYVMYLM